MTTKTKEPKKDAKTEAIEKQEKTLASDKNIIELRPDNIKNFHCPKASPQEIVEFLNICAMFGLSPFKKEIYLIKYGNSPATTVVGYQAYLKRAERSGKWSGIASGIKEGYEPGKPETMTAWAKAWRTDWKEPAYVEVDYSEYVQVKKDYATGKIIGPNIFWEGKPKTMLKKVAVSQVLRLAFPDETASLPYTMFETDIEAKAMGEIIDGEIVEEEKPEEKKPEEKPKPEPKPDKEPDRPLELTEEDNAVYQKEEKPKEEEKAPEPEPELPEPGKPEGLVEQQELKTEPKPEEDPELEAMKNGVQYKLNRLIAKPPQGYGRDEKHLIGKIHASLKTTNPDKQVRVKIPQGLTKPECELLLRVLQLTIKSEEEKRKKTQEAL